jgi:hypothetical protein
MKNDTTTMAFAACDCVAKENLISISKSLCDSLTEKDVAIIFEQLISFEGIDNVLENLNESINEDDFRIVKVALDNEAVYNAFVEICETCGMDDEISRDEFVGDDVHANLINAIGDWTDNGIETHLSADKQHILITYNAAY